MLAIGNKIILKVYIGTHESKYFNLMLFNFLPYILISNSIVNLDYEGNQIGDPIIIFSNQEIRINENSNV